MWIRCCCFGSLAYMGGQVGLGWLPPPLSARNPTPLLSAQNLTPRLAIPYQWDQGTPQIFYQSWNLTMNWSTNQSRIFDPSNFSPPSAPRVSISLVFYQIHILLTKLSLKYNPYTQINVLKCTFLVIPPFSNYPTGIPHWCWPPLLAPKTRPPLLEFFLTPPHTTNPPPTYGNNPSNDIHMLNVHIFSA